MKKDGEEEEKKEAVINGQDRDNTFERDLSRNMHMQGERKIKLEDISFESEAYNIYDPFFSSDDDYDDYESDDYTDTSDE